VSHLLDIASLDDVLFVGPASTMKPHDERSAQIIAGNLTADQSHPNGPGYFAWLASKGLDLQPDFVVDVTDSGIDRGLNSASSLHPDFLDSALQSRVSYDFNYANDGFKDDRTGHGTLVASIT